MMGKVLLRQLALIFGVAGMAATLPQTCEAARPTPGAIGVNLGPFYSAGEQIPFVDVFKMSAPWTLHSNTLPGQQTEPALDENGWVTKLEPGEYAETSIFTGSSGHYPAGEYTLTYEGKGTLTASGAGVSITDSAPGRILISVRPTTGVPNNGIQIRETGVDPSAPIKNIRLFLPGFEAEPQGNPFNPKFIALLRPFKVIRFIGWAHVNRSDTTDWADERPVTYATQASGFVMQKMSGVALEYQIALANLLQADPWFLVPLKATDDYMRNMAALVHDRLNPSLDPYVELSNEVWNPSFPEDAFAQKMGLNLALDSNPTKAGAEWYTSRALQMFDIWNGVFGADAPRIVRVLGSAYVVPPITNIELRYMDAYKHVDALAIGLYMSPKTLRNYDAVSQMTVDQVLDNVQYDIAAKFRDFVGYHLASTKKYGVDLVAYEGGVGLLSGGAPPTLRPRINQTFLEANHSERMAIIYRNLLDEWFSQGGVLFNHFDDCSAPSIVGNFGLVDYQDQDPKTSAIYQMLSSYALGHRNKTEVK
jgi:hypothetical protein